MPPTATTPPAHVNAAGIGRRLQAARKAAGYATAADLARELGVSVWTVHSWEAGKSSPRYPMLATIAQLTGKPPGYFLGQDPSPPDGSPRVDDEPGVYGLAPHNRAAAEALTELSEWARRAGILLRLTTPVVVTAPALAALRQALAGLVRRDVLT